MATQPQNCVFKIPFGKNMKEKYVFCVPCYVLFVWESAFCDQNTVFPVVAFHSRRLLNDNKQLLLLNVRFNVRLLEKRRLNFQT